MSCKDNKDGSCSVEYTPYEPGLYDVNITYGGIHVPGTVAPLGKHTSVSSCGALAQSYVGKTECKHLKDHVVKIFPKDFSFRLKFHAIILSRALSSPHVICLMMLLQHLT